MSRIGNELVIALAPPFGRQKVIVAASKAIRITAANRGTGFIDRALPLFRVEKDASCFEYVIPSVLQDSITRDSLCVLSLGILVRDSKMRRKPRNVSPSNIDSIISAAVRGTLAAVVEHP